MKILLQRFKFLGLLSLALLIFIPFLVFGVGVLNNPDGGYRVVKNLTSIPILHYTDNTVTTVSTIPDCIQNTTGNDYFIPTRTINEWNAFVNASHPGVTLVLCPGQCNDPSQCGTDGFITGGNSCSGAQPQATLRTYTCSSRACGNGTAPANFGAVCSGATPSCSGGSCVQCSEGTWNNSGTCTTCPAGSNCTAGVKYICGRNQYSGTGQAACSSCAAGKSSRGVTGGTTAAVCTNCPIGTTSIGAYDCLACSCNTYNPTAGAGCGLTCDSWNPLGAWNGGASCSICNGGQVSGPCNQNRQMQNTIDGNYYYNISVSMCGCPKGTYWNNPTSACVSCGAGQTTAGWGAMSITACYVGS